MTPPAQSPTKPSTPPIKPRKFEAPTAFLEVPPGWSDESTYILAGPQIQHFRTTIIIKRTPQVSEPDLSAHVDAQLKELGALNEFRLLSRGRAEGIEMPTEAVEFQWTQRDTKLQQRQHYIWFHGDVFTLTATARAAQFAQVSEEISAIMKTFKPRLWGAL